MASDIEFIEYICSQMEDLGSVSCRKMFGDYMIYLNGKPVILACDNIAYIKKHPAIVELMSDSETGIPYDGAKEHYIIDAGHKNHFIQVLAILEEVLPLPKKKTTKQQKNPKGAL